MKQISLASILVATILLAGCSSNDDDWTSGLGTTSSSSGSSTGSITDAEVEFDETALSESETIPSDDDDYVENRSFAHSISIVYDEGSVTLSGDTDQVTWDIDGAHVSVTSTTKVIYTLSGSSDDGSFKLYAENYQEIVLDGLSLTNPNGAAINNQCGKSTFLVLADGSNNTLTDGTTYEVPADEDMKGTIFAEGQIIVSGSGKLTVYATGKNGIASDDYIIFRPGNVINIYASAGHGIKSNDGVTIRGGVLNISQSAAGGKGINSEASVTISGGRTTIITTGTAELDGSDATGAAGIKADSMFVMTQGELNIKSSGAGGKGINCDQDITISGGEITVATTGKEYTGGDGSSPKGIRAEGTITITGGEITITASGGDGAEGLESKSTMNLSGGEIVVSAYDDAINSSGRLTISGGKVYAYASANDGIDSNSTLYITGGTIIASGTTQPEGPFDCDNSTFSITGGTIIGIGGTTSTPSSSVTTQPVILLGSQSYSNGSYIALTNSSGELIMAYQIPRTYSSAVLLVSSPDMERGKTYTFTKNVTTSGGTWWQGFSDDTAVSGGSTIASITQSSYIVSSGSSSGVIGGNGGNGGPGSNGGFNNGWW